jgi:hypothetical protein
MTFHSDTPAVQITGEPASVVPFKRGRGRPTGVKNGTGIKKKPVKKVVINTEAILANSEVKKLTAEVARLNEELKLANSAYQGALMHVEATEKKHKAALIVIGYLEGKIFRE